VIDEPECCGVTMWLHSPDEIRDRGGSCDLRDALLWECLDCDDVRLAVIVTTDAIASERSEQ
jgi:hypothetical protein